MQPIEKSFKGFALRLLTVFYSRHQFSPDQLPLDSFRRILIVRQHDQIGDLLIATPTLRALRKRFPRSHIAIVVKEYTYDIIANNPNIDEIILFYEKFSRWNLKRLRSFWRSLRSQGGYDCAIVLNTISRSFSSDMIALLSKAKYIVGSDHIPLDPSLPEHIYTVIAHRSPEQRTEIERNLDIVTPLGATENNFEYDLVVSDEEKGEASAVFDSLGVMGGKPIVGVHFGAENVKRCFPLDKLCVVIDSIIEKYAAEIILITGPKEIERRDYIFSRVHHKVYKAPVVPLRIVAALMNYFDLFLCNDTGTLHLAASQKVPTVSFHAMNDPAIWKPPHPRHRAVRAEDTLITSITIEQVLDAVDRALETSSDHY